MIELKPKDHEEAVVMFLAMDDDARNEIEQQLASMLYALKEAKAVLARAPEV